jgi:hypothetical protein
MGRVGKNHITKSSKKYKDRRQQLIESLELFLCLLMACPQGDTT